ncbi:hypothetical protein Tco_0370841 [Tanacetum coccineum]
MRLSGLCAHRSSRVIIFVIFISSSSHTPGNNICVGIKSLLEVTVIKLMLLVQKLLLLVLKVNAAGMKVTTAERLQLLEEFMLTEKRSKTYQRKYKDFLKIKIT